MNTTSPTPIPPHVTLLHQVLEIILGPDHNVDLIDLYPWRVQENVDLVDLYPWRVQDIRSTRRAYHNTYHIFDCVGFLWANRDQLLPPDVGKTRGSNGTDTNDATINDNITTERLKDLIIITLALYYHDVIYDPTAGDNEERSADHAINTLTKLSESRLEQKGSQTTLQSPPPPLLVPTPIDISLIHDLVMATKKHAIPEDWLKLSTQEAVVGESVSGENNKVPSTWLTMAETTLPTPTDARRYIRLVSAVLDTDLSIIATNSIDTHQPPSSSSSSSSSSSTTSSSTASSSPTVPSTSLSRFTIYENQIRQEYQHYPINDYALGRSKVMATFAQRGTNLFFTPWAQTTLSPIAISNLKLITPEKYSPQNGWDDDAIVKTFWEFCPERYQELIVIFNNIIAILTKASHSQSQCLVSRL